MFYICFTFSPILACAGEADVVFLLDSSSSVGEANFQRLLRFLANLVAETPVDSGFFRVGALTFR